jgi:glycosyltransferase involved in cell wall biosynthesis
MRIAIVNWSSRKVGGVEAYLNTIIPELARAGHDLAFCSEVDGPADRQRLELPASAPTWCVADAGEQSALTALRQWHPDVIYSHKLGDPSLEGKIIRLAPSVHFAHDYDGMCISGTKAFQFPNVQPCTRRFGWQCLVHYFPHQCGGLNPVTMLELYNSQTKRWENMRACNVIVTHSDHMIEELRKHGLTAQRAYKLPDSTAGDARTDVSQNGCRNGNNELTLLFAGRMEYLKGAHLLIEALPEVQGLLQTRLRVILVGEGRERRSLESRAQKIQSSQIQIEFPGWLERKALENLFQRADLLVVSSVWPEPFGLIGPEAGLFGLPVAAFDVGGIRDWLSHGLNGFLAPANPPTSQGLAAAIVNCLQDGKTYANLRQHALESAKRFTVQNHLSVLFKIFSEVAEHKAATTAAVEVETKV